MTAAPFDTLKLARALRDKAGFSQEHTEAAADALAEIRNEIASLRTDMNAGFRDVELRITIRLGGIIVVATGILLAAKFFG